MRTKNLFNVLIMSSLVLFLSGCSKDDDDAKNKTTIRFGSTFNQGSTHKSGLAQSLVIDNFVINISEIEIEFDDDDPLFDDHHYTDEYEFKGPFVVDLVKNGSPFFTAVINTDKLPNAVYDEIEFEFEAGKNRDSQMYGKSVLVKGQIDNKPFVYWTGEEFEVEIEFEELIRINRPNSIINVSFDLSTLFNPALGGIDITVAKDGNNDGLIEIYPQDPDGNGALAKMITKKMKSIIKAFEDRYDD